MASRDDFRQVAEENRDIFELGLYEAPDGTIVDITTEMAAMLAGTRVVDGPVEVSGRTALGPARITLAPETTVAGIDRLSREGVLSICALNFASARTPGGGYLRGGAAQEEALCRATTLYPSLEKQAAFYAGNKASPNAVYLDDLIYSPHVLLIRDDHGRLRPDPVQIGVVTAPAPNLGALAEQGLSDRLRGEVDRALARRVKRILATAQSMGHDALVLGAWGCGVFGNAPDQVAALFEAALSGPFEGAFQRVHFAVPGRADDPNLTAFVETFGPTLPA